ncbi:MAG: hypothetical protein Q9201_006412 [Fulgogasparrea decipioides]
MLANNYQSFNIAILLAIYETFATVAGLRYFLFDGSDFRPSFIQAQVNASLQVAIGRSRAKGSKTKSSGGAKALVIIEFASQTPYEVYVSLDEIVKGFDINSSLFSTDQLVTNMWTDGVRKSGSATLPTV